MKAKRALAILLSLALLIGLIPVAGLVVTGAAEGADDPAVLEVHFDAGETVFPSGTYNTTSTGMTQTMKDDVATAGKMAYTISFDYYLVEDVQVDLDSSAGYSPKKTDVLQQGINHATIETESTASANSYRLIPRLTANAATTLYIWNWKVEHLGQEILPLNTEAMKSSTAEYVTGNTLSDYAWTTPKAFVADFTAADQTWWMIQLFSNGSQFGSLAGSSFADIQKVNWSLRFDYYLEGSSAVSVKSSSKTDDWSGAPTVYLSGTKTLEPGYGSCDVRVESNSYSGTSFSRFRPTLKSTGAGKLYLWNVEMVLHTANNDIVWTDFGADGNYFNSGSSFQSVTLGDHIKAYSWYRELSSISVATMPTKQTYTVGEAFDPAGLSVALNYSNSTTDTVTTGFTVEGFDSTTIGTKTVTVSYKGKSTTFTVKVARDTPYVSEYSFTANQIRFGGTYTNISGGVTQAMKDAITAAGGMQYSVSFDYYLAEDVQFDCVYIAGYDTTTITDVLEQGIHHFTLDVTAPAGSGNYRLLPDFKTTATTTLYVWNYKVEHLGNLITPQAQAEYTPSSTKKLAEYDWYKQAASIAINALPSKTTYELGEALDTTGLSITVTYDDASTATLTEGFAVEGFDSATTGKKTLTVTYDGVSTTFQVTVTEPVPQAIVADFTAADQTWWMFQLLSSSLTIPSGDSLPNGVTNVQWTLAFDYYLDGTSNVNVKSGTGTASGWQGGATDYVSGTQTLAPGRGACEVVVASRDSNNTSLNRFRPTLKSTGAGTLYVWNVRAIMHTTNGTVEWADFGKNGTYAQSITSPATATLGNKINTYDWYKTATEMSIVTPPTKTEYEIGEALDTTGMSIKVDYDNNTSDTLTSGFTVTGFNSETVGTKTVTVEYGGFTDTFEVTVLEPSPIVAEGTFTAADQTWWITQVLSSNFTLPSGDSIPDKTNVRYTISFDYYLEGENSVKILGGSGNNMDWPGGNTAYVSGTKTLMPGKYSASVTVDCTQMTTDGNSNRLRPQLKSTGEGKLYIWNFKIEMYTTNGTVEWAKYGNDNTYANSAGTATVTGGKKLREYNFPENPVVESIAVATKPSKTAYKLGEAFDASGLSITVSYDNNTSATLTDGFTVSALDSMTAGKQTLTVTFEGKTATFDVAVAPAKEFAVEMDFTAADSMLWMLQVQRQDLTGNNASAVLKDIYGGSTLTAEYLVYELSFDYYLEGGDINMTYVNGTSHVDAGITTLTAGKNRFSAVVMDQYASGTNYNNHLRPWLKATTANTKLYVWNVSINVRNAAGEWISMTGYEYTASKVNTSASHTTAAYADGTLYSEYAWYVAPVTTPTTVYVDDLGNDETGDGTAAKPYKTMRKALWALEQGNYVNRTIVIKNSYTTDNAYDLTVDRTEGTRWMTEYTYPVVIRGETAAATYTLNTTQMNYYSATVLENLTLVYGGISNEKSAATTFFANSHNLTFGTNLTYRYAVINKDLRPSLYVGDYAHYDMREAYTTDKATLTLNGGEFKAVNLSNSMPNINFAAAAELPGINFVMLDGDIDALNLGGQTANGNNSGGTSYQGDVNITINGGKIADGIFVADIEEIGKASTLNGHHVQILLNNSMSLAHLPTQDDVTAMGGGKLYILRAVAKENFLLALTDTVGVYTVIGGAVARAENLVSGEVVESVDGTLTLPNAGDYRITFNTTLADLIQPASEDGKIFVGYTDANGDLYDGDTLWVNGMALTPKWNEGAFADNITSSLREPSNVDKVALRYELSYDKTLVEGFLTEDDVDAGLYKEVTFGAVLIPDVMRNDKDLVLDATYSYKNKVYKAQGVEAKKILAKSLLDGETKTYYSINLTGINTWNYKKPYAIRGYMTFTNKNGVQTTVYSDEIKSVNLYQTAEKLLGVAETEQEQAPFNTLLASVPKYGISDAGDDPIPESVNTATMFDKHTSSVDAQANTLKDSILDLNTTVTSNSGYFSKTIYISYKGSDETGDGTQAKPYRTTAKLMAVRKGSFADGDVVLFERGGVYRDASMDFRGAAVSVGAYGDSSLPKPQLYGSDKNYVNATWTLTDTPNVWQVAVTQTQLFEDHLEDVGNVVFDYGNAVASIGKKLALEDLKENYDFYYDIDTKILYLYLSIGNPATYHNSIEVCPTDEIIRVTDNDDASWWQSTTPIVIENLTMKYSGGHGIATGSNTQITIRGCEIGYMGGSMQYWESKYPDYSDGNDSRTQNVRYGNGIDLLAPVTDATIEYNWIYQCYDAGYTNQGRGEKAQEDITVDHNLIEYCNYNIEAWAGDDQQMTNCQYTNNILRFAGYGFGTLNRIGSASTMVGNISFYADPETGSISITGNIFDGSYRYLVCIVNPNEGSGPVITGNTWIQKSFTAEPNALDKTGTTASVGRGPDTGMEEDGYTPIFTVYGCANQAEMEASVALFDTAPVSVVLE